MNILPTNNKYYITKSIGTKLLLVLLFNNWNVDTEINITNHIRNLKRSEKYEYSAINNKYYITKSIGTKLLMVLLFNNWNVDVNSCKNYHKN
jgi:hypothetical protein